MPFGRTVLAAALPANVAIQLCCPRALDSMNWPTIPNFPSRYAERKVAEPIDRVASDRHERCEHVRTHDNQASPLQPDARAGLPAFGSVHECSLHGAISCMRIPAGRPIT